MSNTNTVSVIWWQLIHIHKQKDSINELGRYNGQNLTKGNILTILAHIYKQLSTLYNSISEHKIPYSLK